jgi:hypothetical protein
VNETTGTTPAAAPLQAPAGGQPVDAGAYAEEPSFGPRGRARRRARFLRKARELAYRDLGGLVFNLHRFGQRNDALVVAKLNTLGSIDGELRTLESALGERQTVTVLREAGITACPRCAAIHGGEDRFCPNCGLPMNRHVDLPIAGAPGAPAAQAPAPAAPVAPAPAAPAPVAPAPVAATPAPIAAAPAPIAAGPAPVAATPAPIAAAPAPVAAGPEPVAAAPVAPAPDSPPPPQQTSPPPATATPAVDPPAPAGAVAQTSAAAASRSPTPPSTAIRPPDPAADTPPAGQPPPSPDSEERTEVLRPRETGR